MEMMRRGRKMSKNNKVDPRVRRTKKFLRDALIQLLKVKDLSSITVQDIIDKAELTRGTFYLHYRDKQHFLTQSMDETLNDLIEQVKPKKIEKKCSNPDKFGPPVSFLQLFNYIAENSDYFRLMLSDKGFPQFRSHLLKLVQKKIYEDLLSSIVQSDEQLAVSKEILISYITSAHIGVICAWLEGGMKFSPEYMATQLTQLTFLGPIRVAGLVLKH